MSSEEKNGLHAVTPDRGTNEKGKRFGMPQFKMPEDPLTRGLIIMIILVLVFALIGIWSYNRVHLFDNYDITRSSERSDAEGMGFELLGKTLIKYGHDGVFAQDMSGTTLWSSAYSMQTPMSSVNGKMMLLYEQLGNHITVLDAEGTRGTYQTALPIRKAVVSRTGVAAVILDGKTETQIGLYTPSGSQIASIRATLEETGYPMDLAVSENGERLMVSYMAMDEGKMAGRIVFYDFSEKGAGSDDHIQSSFSYRETVFPEVFFLSDGRGAAVGDDRFTVYSSGQTPAEKVNVPLEKEIVSCFHDENVVGFIFPGTESEERYGIEAYSYSGRRRMQAAFDFEYEEVKMDGGEVLLCDSGNLYSFRLSGRARLSAAYEKEVNYFRKLSGSRKYLVITPDSTDQIRIR